MIGTVAVTDKGWYEFLRDRPDLREINFWRPSAKRRFRAPPSSPFLFKLRAPDSAICGFANFATYSALPIWWAWETFGQANGCATLQDLLYRVGLIRDRIRFSGDERADEIGCTLVVDPVFFPAEAWVEQPRDWKPRTQTSTKYDLASGEGRRVWEECLAVAGRLTVNRALAGTVAEPGPRYGSPALVRSRLGQKTFQVAVMDAYGRACSVTDEHSLPALEAAHIRPYHQGGEHTVSNGLLLRADLHRLFDAGYVTIDPDLRFVVSGRLKSEFSNGRTYYPLHGASLRMPVTGKQDRPAPDALRWHNENVFAAR